MKKTVFATLFAAFCYLSLTQNSAWACACGCGIFDVGTSSMFPTGAGGTVYFGYDFSDQNQNWSTTAKASADQNDDKRIQTSFMTAGMQYMFNRSWGIQAELPYDHRYFETTDPETGDIVSFEHSALGDLRLRGIYTGFSPDMSTGITFGAKLPTGDWKNSSFDRDTEIGTGSTDVLLGAYHMDSLTKDDSVKWFIQDLVDFPVIFQQGYRPGIENDAAAGVYYDRLSAGGVKITPVAQIVGSLRGPDSGWAANPTNSGYERALLSPGLEFDYEKVMVYGDVEFPVYQRVNGDQLVASALFKLNISYKF